MTATATASTRRDLVASTGKDGKTPRKPPRRRSINTERGEWLFLVPGAVTILIFFVIPALYVVYLSFFHSTITQIPESFAGGQNYQDLFTSKLFLHSLLTTALFAIGVTALVIGGGLLLATQLNRGLSFTRGLRSLIFLPYVFPFVASGIAFTFLLQPQDGLVAVVLRTFGIQAPNWLADSHTALIAVILVTVWQFLGFYMLIFLSGLQGIDEGLHEAARLDGASETAIFWRITFPLLTPNIFFACVISVIQCFQAFDQIFAMTQGGPSDATSTLTYFIYTEAFQAFNFGNASAASVFMLVLLGLITVAQFALSRRWVYRNEDYDY